RLSGSRGLVRPGCRLVNCAHVAYPASEVPASQGRRSGLRDAGHWSGRWGSRERLGGKPRRRRGRGAAMISRLEQGSLATVIGGSGFLGRYVVRALAADDWRIRAASRRPELAGFLQPMGAVGQIHAVQANLRYPDSVRQVVEGATTVVNLVGILAECRLCL